MWIGGLGEQLKDAIPDLISKLACVRGQNVVLVVQIVGFVSELAHTRNENLALEERIGALKCQYNFICQDR